MGAAASGKKRDVFTARGGKAGQDYPLVLGVAGTYTELGLAVPRRVVQFDPTVTAGSNPKKPAERPRSAPGGAAVTVSRLRPRSAPGRRRKNGQVKPLQVSVAGLHVPADQPPPSEVAGPAAGPPRPSTAPAARPAEEPPEEEDDIAFSRISSVGWEEEGTSVAVGEEGVDGGAGERVDPPRGFAVEYSEELAAELTAEDFANAAQDKLDEVRALLAAALGKGARTVEGEAAERLASALDALRSIEKQLGQSSSITPRGLAASTSLLGSTLGGTSAGEHALELAPLSLPSASSAERAPAVTPRDTLLRDSRAQVDALEADVVVLRMEIDTPSTGGGKRAGAARVAAAEDAVAAKEEQITVLLATRTELENKIYEATELTLEQKDKLEALSKRMMAELAYSKLMMEQARADKLAAEDGLAESQHALAATRRQLATSKSYVNQALERATTAETKWQRAEKNRLTCVPPTPPLPRALSEPSRCAAPGADSRCSQPQCARTAPSTQAGDRSRRRGHGGRNASAAPRVPAREGRAAVSVAQTHGNRAEAVAEAACCEAHRVCSGWHAARPGHSGL